MWTFGRRIAAGFAVSFALLALVGVVSYRSIDTLTKTSYLVNHTYAVIERVAGLLQLLGELVVAGALGGAGRGAGDADILDDGVDLGHQRLAVAADLAGVDLRGRWVRSR